MKTITLRLAAIAVELEAIEQLEAMSAADYMAMIISTNSDYEPKQVRINRLVALVVADNKAMIVMNTTIREAA